MFSDIFGQKNVVSNTSIADIEKAVRQANANAATNARQPITNTTYGGSTTRNDVESSAARKGMIAMRLRVPDGHMLPFDFLETHLAGEEVFVFVANKDQYVVFKDAVGLFPSDALVTQLRLVAK